MTTRPKTAVYRHSLREAKVILSLWFVASVWSCGYCYLYGYAVHEPDAGAVGPTFSELLGPLTTMDRRPDSLRTPWELGIPDWIWYGVFLPWIGCIAFTFWFCLAYFQIDDLGQEPSSPGESDPTPQVSQVSPGSARAAGEAV